MPSADDAVGWYEGRAEALARQYEAVPADEVHVWLQALLPTAPALLLDVGVETDRDAAWLASQGYEVLAVEPSVAMRREGQPLHPANRIRWLEDRLATLATILRLGLPADVILLSGV
ncbi:methyltransferase domain-containing protein [Paracraurococcus lichenis]|uniref:Class I SAM-dependent methyltransferase n=1 Tax=Paracraurococcus lichenis TaxID=3064888 RepID=A0ABT9EAF2_9PROT|nr:hypothetical protein [Paracraurococcus sp. LOR1-02]MDO9713149.1 hypothetical protein [Paracraurococcus sp. LOR1-02]